MTTSISPHSSTEASSWIQRWSHLLLPNACVLDVACGAGRHIRWFAERGHRVWGVDRDLAAAQAMVQGLAPLQQAAIELVQADLEGAAWPLMGSGTHQTFGAVVVTNYLWRPLMPDLLQSLAPGGVLLYETFAAGNETVGRPARADFLLRPGELLEVCKDLHVVAYEQGFATAPERYVQRIAAVRPTSQNLTPADVRGHGLSG